MTMPTVAEALNEATRQLAPMHESARLDAQVLLCHVLGRPRSYLYAWPEQTLAPEAYARYRELLARRWAGEPVAYLIGRREFWSLDLAVTPATLIPRPETELLVERALARIPADAAWRVLDLGTGSGAVALAIAHERPGCTVTAVEASPEALAVARRNTERLGRGNVELVGGKWFEPVLGRHFEVIVSNPPYIPDGDPHLSQGDVRFEPRSALTAGADGLDDIRAIAASARAHLTAGGWLLLEHGYNQGEAVGALLTDYGYGEVSGYLDAAGYVRITEGQRKS